jgi:uncharacterized protein YtpQ (UPF0354 family)
MFKTPTPPPTVPPKLDGYDAANPLRVAIRERMKQELQSDMAASYSTADVPASSIST